MFAFSFSLLTIIAALRFAAIIAFMLLEALALGLKGFDTIAFLVGATFALFQKPL